MNTIEGCKQAVLSEYIVTRILLVQDDPCFCDVVSDYLKPYGSEKWEYAMNGTSAAQMLAARHFDIALINATLPDASGIELARLACNEDTPVLMISENTNISNELKRLDYQFLQKPFSFDVLVAESKRVMLKCADHSDSLRSVATSQVNLQTLMAEIAESNQRFDSIMKNLGYVK